jgi:actin-related protein
LLSLRLIPTSQDLKALFDESLQTIDGLIVEQIESAKANNTLINKVVLVGGFRDSPALKEHLQASLATLNSKFQTSIKLVVAPPSKSATSVTIRAIMRAHNKSNRPTRVLSRSISVR